jgi:tyrosinase
MINAKPTWNDDILPFFTAPFWLPESHREAIAEHWQGCMVNYGVDLQHYNDVKQQSVTIYNHLASKSMPLTSDERQFWPIDALETFRHWVNQGWRLDQSTAFDHSDRIATPSGYQPHLLVRKDIRSLSDIELNRYRAALDDIMQVSNADASSPWQRFGYLHTNWCLHYQEAFAFWHRGYLMQLEQQIGMAIPYWDWMAIDASVDGSDQAGLPAAFLAETYQHPDSGEIRPNPLRYAAAKDGCSKACRGTDTSNIDCATVQRNPLFYTSGAKQQQQRQALYSMTAIFQQQVVDALKFEQFSQPQGAGHPWANIPNFEPPQPDAPYIYRDINFDGLYEQPHDNYHGWIGGDMADNAYTAFDPIFYSFHANIDRMLEVWLRNHPQAQFSAAVALRPFSGSRSETLEFSTPDLWRYTSIGQLAQDSRRIGYDFGPPVAEQFGGVLLPQQGIVKQRSREQANETGNTAWIVFDHVRCTQDSYTIDVFINQPITDDEDCHQHNPHYVGRFSRIGMGMVDQNNRCIRHGVCRYLNADHAINQLGLAPDSQVTISTRVKHLDSGLVLSQQEQQQLPGFTPLLVWGDPQATTVSSAPAPACCTNA